ncbi:MAG: PilZ domain-containing protein [Lachnospiraceae bacterium]|nr:PilZ domain-containing protein [Lachnospiraceae bacterium]
MTISDLEAQHAVTLVVTVGLNSRDLPTAIAEVHDDYVLLEPILLDEQTVGFDSSCNIDFLYTQEHTLYAWYSVSLPLVKIKEHTYYQVSLQGEANIYNRRDSFRVYIGENMTITAFHHTGPQPFSVLIRDISETGFGFISKEKYDTGRIVRFSLPLAGRQSLALAATVVRREFNEETLSYSYGCKFAEQNSYLSSYLMGKQRERQKEKMKSYSAVKRRY